MKSIFSGLLKTKTKLYKNYKIKEKKNKNKLFLKHLNIWVFVFSLCDTLKAIHRFYHNKIFGNQLSS